MKAKERARSTLPPDASKSRRDSVRVPGSMQRCTACRWLPAGGAIGVHALLWLMLNAAPAPALPTVTDVSASDFAVLPARPAIRQDPAARVSQAVPPRRPVQSSRASATIPVLPDADNPSGPGSAVDSSVAAPVIDIREIFADQISGEHDPAVPVFVPGSVAPPGYLDAMQVWRRPRARQDLAPVYPQDAFARRAAGRVVVEILIGENGLIDALQALVATPGFADSALGALGTMTFDPALLDSRPVAVRMLVEIVYSVTDLMIIQVR